MKADLIIGVCDQVLERGYELSSSFIAMFGTGLPHLVGFQAEQGFTDNRAEDYEPQGAVVFPRQPPGASRGVIEATGLPATPVAGQATVPPILSASLLESIGCEMTPRNPWQQHHRRK